MESLLKLSSDLARLVLDNKAAFGSLFLFNAHDRVFIFRPLFVSECESIYKLSDYIDESDIDEWVVSRTIITDNLSFILNDAPAGLCASLAAIILSKSTLEDIKEMSKMLEEERESKSKTANLLDSMVKIGAGHFLKNSKDITYKQQLEYVVLAEDMTGKKLELTTQTLPKSKSGKKFSPEVAAILSKEAADIPDFKKDNIALKGL